MGNLIVIVGSTGVGKTTLARVLGRQSGFVTALENHAHRPWQEAFKTDPRLAFHNQVDFLLYRIGQEQAIRENADPGVMDGGLDMDFHGFSRLFAGHGWLTGPEFDLCRQLYTFARKYLPPPNLIIHLVAAQETIAKRLAARSRINIASSEDSSLLDTYLQEWLATLDQGKILSLDVSLDDPEFRSFLPRIMDKINMLDGT